MKGREDQFHTAVASSTRARRLVKKGKQVRQFLSSKHFVLIQSLVGWTLVRKHPGQEEREGGERMTSIRFSTGNIFPTTQVRNKQTFFGQQLSRCRSI